MRGVRGVRGVRGHGGCVCGARGYAGHGVHGYTGCKGYVGHTGVHWYMRVPGYVGDTGDAGRWEGTVRRVRTCAQRACGCARVCGYADTAGTRYADTTGTRIHPVRGYSRGAVCGYMRHAGTQGAWVRRVCGYDGYMGTKGVPGTPGLPGMSGTPGASGMQARRVPPVTHRVSPGAHECTRMGPGFAGRPGMYTHGFGRAPGTSGTRSRTRSMVQ